MELFETIENIVNKKKEWLIIYNGTKELNLIKIHLTARGADETSLEKFELKNCIFYLISIDNLNKKVRGQYSGVIVTESIKNDTRWECLIPVSSHASYVVALDLKPNEITKNIIIGLIDNGYFKSVYDIADFLEDKVL